jgi:hypothetical protein
VLPPSACPPGERPEADGCVPAGVPADACGVGFSHVDAGCEPVLPATECPPGQLAQLGETRCHPVAPCGTGTWGDIPIDSDTQHVDASYAGLDSDGSVDKPWTTIDDAFAAALPGALIAVAAGDYVDDLIIIDKPVRLWGRCPEMVSLSGAGVQQASIIVANGASGTEIVGLGVSGPAIGIIVTGSEDVLLDRLWVHHTTTRGINLQNDLGPTSAILRDSLVEDLDWTGAYAIDADFAIERTVVRRIAPDVDGLFGRGVWLARQDLTTPVAFSVSNSKIEDTHDVALLVANGDIVLSDTLIRRTMPEPGSGTGGRGIGVQDTEAGLRRPVLSGLVIEDSHEYGIYVGGSAALVEHSVVRRTHWLPAIEAGIGIAAIENRFLGVPSDLELRASLVEGCEGAALHVSGSQALLASVLVRDNLPTPSGAWGRALQVQPRAETGRRSDAIVRHCLFENSHESGAMVTSSSLTIEASRITGTTARAVDGFFGDGLAVVTADGDALTIGRAVATVVGSLIDASDRAGVSNFGADSQIEATRLSCNQLDLNGQDFAGGAYAFVDLGGSVCGCDEEVACKVLSTDLLPPAVLP